jgi:hypothetical protein
MHNNLTLHSVNSAHKQATEISVSVLIISNNSRYADMNFSHQKNVSAARKRRALRLLRKAQVLNNPKLLHKAEMLLEDANKAFFLKTA